jgi:hypothetical protein
MRKTADIDRSHSNNLTDSGNGVTRIVETKSY